MNDSKFLNARIDGFDYLRAICSVLVVVWHMGGGGKSMIWSKDHFIEHTFTASDFVNFHIFLLAVPTFIFISIFLYIFKGAGNANLISRLKRILVLVTFWPTALITFQYGPNALANLIPHSMNHLIFIVLRGGTAPYYFFVSLIICLLTAHFFVKLKSLYQILGFLFSTILLICLPGLAETSGYYSLTGYWDPLNFIPISFTAMFFAKKLDYIRSKKMILLAVSIVLCIVSAIFEWNCYVSEILFNIQGYAIPAYTRISLLFGVSAMAVIALTTSIRSNSIIRFMSRYSLALYCLHMFLTGPVTNLVSGITENAIVLTYGSIILVVLLSYAIAMILRIYLKENVLF